MNAFLDLLKFIFLGLFIMAVVVTLICWISASMDTLHYTTQNNVLLKELCTKNGLNVDSLLNTTQNDTLNLNIDLKGE